jgi:DNA ligase 1
MQHGRPWRGENVAGWFACEKLDGCRGYWDGQRMWSRSGRWIPIPDVWTKKLPAMHLDGEIWGGRGNWETTVAAVVRGQWAPTVCFMVFDAPEIQAPWPTRLAAAKRKLRGKFAAPVPFQQVEDLQHVAQIFRTVRLAGGEGLMLVHPTEHYSSTRTSNVLKVKKCPLTGELAWSERRRTAA